MDIETRNSYYKRKGIMYIIFTFPNTFLINSTHEFHLMCLKPLLTFTTLWANSADDKLMIFFLFFPGNRIWHFVQIVSAGWRQFVWNVNSCFLGK